MILSTRLLAFFPRVLACSGSVEGFDVVELVVTVDCLTSVEISFVDDGLVGSIFFSGATTIVACTGLLVFTTVLAYCAD